MQKKCIKKKAAGQKECISKNKNAKGSQKKCKKKSRTAVQKKSKKCKKNAHTTKFYTPPFLCDFWWHFWHFLRFLGMRLHFLCFFVRVFLRFFAFSQGNAQKMKKKTLKKRKYKAKNAKAKTRTFFIAFVLLFGCIFCIFCALFLLFVCLFCAFLHFCAVFCIGLVDKCVFFAFLRFFCIPRHPLVTCFCVFCAFFRDWFCIIFALFMHFLFCCVIRTSFSVHHNSSNSRSSQ